jgi:hypothetical protein
VSISSRKDHFHTKSFGQKSIFLAHSGGKRNLSKITLLKFIFSHYGPKICEILVDHYGPFFKKVLR